MQPYRLQPETDLSAEGYDGAVFVSSLDPGHVLQPDPFRSVLQRALKLDSAIGTEGAVLEVNIPSGRFVYSPTGPMNMEFDDVRSYGEAAYKGINRALKAGMKNPLLVLSTDERFPQCELVTLLGALSALYVPIQLRESVPEKSTKVQSLGVWSANIMTLPIIVEMAQTLEDGRIAARDIGGGDPERMTPIRVEQYVKSLFSAAGVVKVEVVSDPAQLDVEFPLFSAVDRAARTVERHRGRVIFLYYNGGQDSDRTLMLVGKGVSYDTGGADIKAGGVMAGMSRDKCGAAAVAGFFKVLEVLRPKNMTVVGALCMVRNSVGEECYVADEIVTARSGIRVRVGNTDAEGRMAMADVLCKMKEMTVHAMDPHLMTVATLTGHAVVAVGNGYTIVLDNGPARETGHSCDLQAAGERIGDMVEVSTIRREDYAFHKGKSEGDDVHQSNNLPSTKTSRGHQSPAAFLVLASGLDKHGLGSDRPIKYSHLDIAASAGWLPDEPTGAPILALAALHLLGMK